MLRQFLCLKVSIILCIAISSAYGIERGRDGEGRSEGRQSPGGSWGERSHQGGSGHRNYGQPQGEQGRRGESQGASGFDRRSPEYSGTEGATSKTAGSEGRTTSGSENHDAAAGAAAENRRQPQYSGAQGAAAGAAAANRNSPQYSGAQGAAAGAAYANRNQPKYSGAQGAAAGAAAANRNQPKYSGAEGAAAGAAVANRNQPQLTGAQGAALGAAAANQNQPQLSGAQGAAIGAAAANQQQLSGGQGAAIGAAAANPAGPAVSGAPGAADAAVANPSGPGGAIVAGGFAIPARISFSNYKLFTQQWHDQNPDAWRTSRWVAGDAWSPTSWRAVSAFYGSNAAPTWYDYGDNITYQNGEIMMNGRDVGTAEQFSQQAADLADVGAASEPTDLTWLPLGVFAMVRNEQQHPHLIMQLAINRQGMLRGNYTDEITENTQPIRGAVNQNTQRAAWIVGNHKTLVMEAGLSNLAEGDAPALIHKSGKTDHWLLVRLEQPRANGSAPAAPPVAK